MTREVITVQLPQLALFAVEPLPAKSPKLNDPFPKRQCPECLTPIPRNKKWRMGDLCSKCMVHRDHPHSDLICGELKRNRAGHCCAIGKCRAIPF